MSAEHLWSTDINSRALVKNYFAEGKNVYLKDVTFDTDGNPVCLYLTASDYKPGPQNVPREWRCAYWNGSDWEDQLITTSDHNYDMGSLFINGDEWRMVAPVLKGPQPWGSGGEIAIYLSRDRGKTWSLSMQVTNSSSRNHNYIRRVVNGKAPFEFFWADGNPNEFGISRLYIGDLSGNVAELPYTMNKEETTLIFND